MIDLELIAACAALAASLVSLAISWNAFKRARRIKRGLRP
jgi:hypothetical protein